MSERCGRGGAQIALLVTLVASAGWGASAVPLESGLQPAAGIPSVVGAVEFKQITGSARLYAPQENPGFGATSMSSATQQDVITQALGFTFVTYYDASNRVSLARRPVAGGEWQTITLTNTVVTVDNHKTPNIAISERDGRIHLAYGHHEDNLRYRVSVTGAATSPNFTKALFDGAASAERNFLKANEPLARVTYPIFVTREISRQLLMFWREGASGNGDLYVSTYNPATGTWGSKIHVIKGLVGTYTDPTGTAPNSPTNRRNPYTNDIITFGNDIHLTWTWREANPRPAVPGLIVNHDLMYARSTDGGLTWTNDDGAVVGTSGPGNFKMDLNSDVKVTQVNGQALTLDYNWDLINQNTSYVDSQGNTHVVLFHGETGSGSAPWRYWHYVRSGATWTRTMIPGTSGIRPKMFIDRNTDKVYVAGGARGVLNLWAANKGTNDWGMWTRIYTTGTVLNFKNDGFNGRLSADGRTLWLVGQRAGAAPDSTSSRLETIKFTLAPNV